MKQKPNILTVVIISILLTLGLYIVSAALPSLLPCTDKLTQELVLALCAGVGFYFVFGGRNHWLVAGAVIVILLTLWLGTYPVKQPRSSSWFTVTTQTRGTFNLSQGAILTLAAGKPTALQLQTQVPTRCNWISAQGGAFDDPQSCDTMYIPPQNEYDIIKVSIQPTCGLPRSVGQIKISILPP